MNITVTVIDGVFGHPADGVEVTVVGRLAGDPADHRAGGITNQQGDFTYSPEGNSFGREGCYTMEVNIDGYYASLGMAAGYEQVTIVVRVVNTQADYHVGMLITPFAHATWSAR